MQAACPTCGSSAPARGTLPCLSVGTVLGLVGGLGLATAFFMPWFAVQGLLLSGDFLARFLGNPAQLRQFAPALAGSPSDVQLLRVLVYLFPTAGAVALVLALVRGILPGRHRWLGGLLAASGLVSLVAVLGGATRLPPGATWEVGLWQLAVASVAIVLAPGVDMLLVQRSRLSS